MSPKREACTCVFVLFLLWLVLMTAGCTSQATPDVLMATPFAAVGVGQSIQLTAIVTNDESALTWTATTGTVSSTGLYTAPSGTQSMTVTVTATTVKMPAHSATATINVVAPGAVTPTANVQVANYTIAPAAAGNVSIQFGTTTSYGLTTWTQPVPTGGGPVSLFVAGMKMNTLYHMRGVVEFADGSTFYDADQTFTTQAVPAAQLPAVSTTTTPGTTPQSGVEFLAMVTESPTLNAVAVTNLAGNVLWTYSPGNAIAAGAVAQPFKQLPNGHFLINFGITNLVGETTSSLLQEIDLSGKVIWQLSSAQLNQELAAATCAGCNITIVATHHDFVALPNGHVVVLASTQQVISGTTVTGDVVIDLDQNHNPVWLWNEFDHLDINRRPYLYPDWTHTNAILYSADDGNLIVSIRHQNWLVKIDYANGNGTGNILWHLGYQGDFTLVGGTDPTDWFYAQHGPSFTTSNTTGQFGLAVFDNGDDRFFPSGQVICTGPSASCYSTVPLLNIDETAMTATLTFHTNAPFYSFFGGNTEVLPNGDIEFCEAAEPATISGGGLAGDAFEVTQSGNAETVWHSKVTGVYVYRSQRMPSLYPGVQW
jgi:arylsulfate sulfotransferase